MSTSADTIVRGRARVFGDDINTDYIISAAHKQAVRSPKDAVQWLMDDIAPGFSSTIQSGDVIVAGRNFGCGSSREAAPVVIAASGLGGVVAQSYARIFFRNSVNVGLPILTLDTSGTHEGDQIEVNFAAGTLRNLTQGFERSGPPLPPFVLEIMREGGLVSYFKKHGHFPSQDALVD